MAARRFTREEADEMLPHIAPLLFGLQRTKQDHDQALAKVAELSRVMRGNGHVQQAELEAAQRAVQAAAERITKALERLNEMGVELKSIEMGLVDFRSTREGREVYLCWRLGEERVSYWHELDAGFAGRQPLEED
jgi:hypothetical protein